MTDASNIYQSFNDYLVVDARCNVGIGTYLPRFVLDIDSSGISEKSGFNIPVNSSATIPSSAVNGGAIRWNPLYNSMELTYKQFKRLATLSRPVIQNASQYNLSNIGMQTIITGSNFEPLSEWTFIGSNGLFYPCISQYNYASQVILTRPVELPSSNAPYRLKVYNPNSGYEYVSPYIQLNAGTAPIITTTAGLLSNLDRNRFYNSAFDIYAYDELGGSITNIYLDSSISSSGLTTTFTSSNVVGGRLRASGTTINTANYITYSFNAIAVDAGGNTASRLFTLNLQNFQGLYPFTAITFTNASATGNYGPSLTSCRNAYLATNAWTSNIDYFNVSGNGIQVWTVPTSGTYSFTVAGARGGNVWTYPGGAGRIISQTGVSLTVGQLVYLVVGQHGGDSINGQYVQNISAGGGGGSFVYLNSIARANCILVAGGGGGAPWSATPASIAGSTSTSGIAGGAGTRTAQGGSGPSGSFAGGAGGTGGAGGSAGQGADAGTAGTNLQGGVGGLDRGTGGAGGGGGMGVGDTGATFLGGFARNVSQPGGFGGGGSAGGVAEYGGRGGGGGYSGGGGGGGSTMGIGGGGGSYSAYGSGYNNNVGTNASHGYITVTFTG
jgi:hypothetical protein